MTFRPMVVVLAWAACLLHAQAPHTSTVTRDQSLSAMRKAAEFYTTKVAKEGGYHYYYA